MSETFDLIDVQRMLRTACAEAGGQKAFAEAHGLSPAYVSDVVTARKVPGTAIAEALGLVRLPVRYARRRISEVAA